MQQFSRQFNERLSLFNKDALLSSLTGIQRGVERETLRINSDGSLAQTNHPQALGSALTHHFITTDFAEPLLEFITPPETLTKTTLAQLEDTHKFAIENIGDERLWPMSMPCYISREDDIRLAEYGSSNVGQMKHLYRKGLKNRYGSMMQTISGIHFNFSLPDAFWQAYLPEVSDAGTGQNVISAAYFALVRNYRRFCWLLPYLYGASPTMCSSFLGSKNSNMNFEKFGKGSLYLPDATSLRMSDLGYTNNDQSRLRICYNHLDTYIAALRKAINTPSPQYEAYGGKVDGQFRQLNSNILQIENELYSPIRPKQPTISLEKPTDALESRGVSYIEVRVMDVNPFSPVGISQQQMHFLDVFLLYCLLKPSDEFDMPGYEETERNLKRVVVSGRRKGLMLEKNGVEIGLREWGNEMLDEMAEIASLLDKANQTQVYTQALAKEKQAVNDASLTLSGQIVERLFATGETLDNGKFGLTLADQYRQNFLKSNYQILNEAFFKQQAELSLKQQALVESEDKVDFDTFMHQKFGV
ncbi:glutamate--cysteine ligase [Alteromonas sp. a30]|uniref:glutamate--cysteine ligase n=1 Tax=Alteromonas sp. a30 TaxID=2730917 RepID=UPI002281E94B|nr:glutamate--cysteine ligase [Alteromonas sp. a30]MCY7296582.1 glutamate--cysteine ligase [Alteromonas sp. a30]